MDPIIKEPSSKAKACIIWMHGLGADAQDMLGLATQMQWSSVATRHIFLNAPTRPVTINHGMSMPAWYDICGTALTDREDSDGIRNSAAFISKTIAQQRAQGIHSKAIFLCGFSQGGAMALYTGLHEEPPLGGIIALSAYLPLAASIKPQQSNAVPIFFAAGSLDPVVMPQWSDASERWLREQGYQNLCSQRYAIQHCISTQEIVDLQLWIDPILKGVSHDNGGS